MSQEQAHNQKLSISNLVLDKCFLSLLSSGVPAVSNQLQFKFKQASILLVS